MANRHPLTDLPRVLIEAGYDDAPKYRTIYTAAVDGRLPAQRDGGGRWTFNADELPQIIEALGLAHDVAA